MRARVEVRLKAGVLDPQGAAIGRALGQLGFRGRGRGPPGQADRARARPRRQGQGRGGDPGDVRAAAGQSGDRDLHGRVRRLRGRGPGAPRDGLRRGTRAGGRDHLSGLQLRSRHRSRARRGRRAGRAAVARRDRAAAPRPDRAAGRLHLWRLSALRRDRGACAGDGRGDPARRGRSARARDLQRLPDPGRGRAAAGCLDQQCRAQVHLPAGRARGRDHGLRLHCRLRAGPDRDVAGRPPRRLLRPARRTSSRGSRRRIGSRSATSPTRTARSAGSRACSARAATCSA